MSISPHSLRRPVAQPNRDSRALNFRHCFPTGCNNADMPDPALTVTPEELLDAARSAGFKITYLQLRRWHLAGALPRPTQVSLGRPQGSVALYPAETTGQVVRLCQLHRREKRLGHIAWALWWEGYRVDTVLARAFLADVAQGLDKTLAKVRWLLADDAASSALFEKSISARISHALVRQVRKRVGSHRFPQVVDLIMRVAIGSFTGYALFSEEQEVVERGLGLDRARADRMYSAPPWLLDSEEPLVKLSALLKDASFSASLEAASDSELECARAELRRFMTLMEGFGETVGQRFGRGAFGMVLFGVGQRFLRIDDYARQCLLWIHIRGAENMQHGMSEILAIGPAVDGLLQSSKAIDVLVAEVPAYAPLLAPRRMKAAAQSTEAHANQMKALREAYETNRVAVEAFTMRHPDLMVGEEGT